MAHLFEQRHISLRHGIKVTLRQGQLPSTQAGSIGLNRYSPILQAQRHDPPKTHAAPPPPTPQPRPRTGRATAPHWTGNRPVPDGHRSHTGRATAPHRMGTGPTPDGHWPHTGWALAPHQTGTGPTLDGHRPHTGRAPAVLLRGRNKIPIMNTKYGAIAANHALRCPQPSALFL